MEDKVGLVGFRPIWNKGNISLHAYTVTPACEPGSIETVERGMAQGTCRKEGVSPSSCFADGHSGSPVKPGMTCGASGW